MKSLNQLSINFHMLDGSINALGNRSHNSTICHSMGLSCDNGKLRSTLTGADVNSILDVINNQINAVYEINQCFINSLLGSVAGDLDNIKRLISNYTLNKYTFGNPFINTTNNSGLDSAGADKIKPQTNYSNYIVSTSKLTQWWSETGVGKQGQVFGRGYQGWKVTVTFDDGSTSQAWLEKTMVNPNPPVNLVKQTATDAAIAQALKQYTEGTQWNGTVTNVIDVTKVQFPKIEVPTVDLSFLNNL